MQKSVAVSKTEAEYMALSLTSQQLIQIKKDLEQLRQNAKYSSTSKTEAYCLLGGDWGSLEPAKDPRACINRRSKHTDIHITSYANKRLQHRVYTYGV